MNNWMLKGFSKYPFDVANLSFRDIRFSGIALAKDQYENHLKETPILSGMVSANMIPAKDLDQTVAPNPYIIKEVKGPRFGNKPMIKVGFIGLTEPGPGGRTGFIVEDPLQKIKTILPEVRAKVDVVVVLGYFPPNIAKDLATQNPDIDIIIGGNGAVLPPTAQREGKTVIVYSMNQTKQLGELRLYFGPEGKITDYLNRYILLDTAIPSPPEIVKLVEDSKAEITAAKVKAEAASPVLKPGESLQFAPPVPNTPPTPGANPGAGAGPFTGEVR